MVIPRRGGKELLLGILSCWPIVYLFLSLFLLFTLLDAVFDNEEDLSGFAKALGTVLIYLFYPTAILMLSLIFNFIFYYIFRGNRVPQDSKILWTVLLITINIFALPVFWYSYIWDNKNIGGG